MHNADNKRTENKYYNRNESVKEKMKEIASLKKNTNIYENISTLSEHQSSMDYLKYINCLKFFYHSDQ